MAEMTVQEREIIEHRAKVWDGMRAVMEKMEQGLELSVEDRADFDKRNKKISGLDKDLERVRQYQRLAGAAEEVREAKDTRGDGSPKTSADRLYESAFLKYLAANTTDTMTPDEHRAWAEFSSPTVIRRPQREKPLEQGHDSGGREARVGFSQYATRDVNWTEQEYRASLDANSLTTAPDSGGISAGATGYTAGYLIPQGYWHNLQIAIKAYGGILPYLQMIQTDSGQPMPWPTVDPTQIVGRYITETAQLGFGGDSNGTDYQFGQGMLNAWTLVSGVILASVQLINDSAFAVDGFVNDRIGESIGRKVAAEIHTGTGSSAFLGVETALNARGHQTAPALGGVYLSGTGTKWAATAGGSAFTLAGSTAGGSITASAKLANGLIGFDDVLGMISTVDPAYRISGRCIFVANDLTFSMLRTITDAYGHPLWSPAVAPGQPDTLYGYPAVVDQNTSAVSTSASTSGGLLFGDFKTAMIARQVNGATMMRLTERYADYLQVGYLGYCRMDCRSNDLRAAAIYSTNQT